MPTIQELFQAHLKKVGIDDATLQTALESETLPDDVAASIQSKLGKLMTPQLAISDRNIRNAVIKDIMTSAETAIGDHVMANGLITEEEWKALGTDKRMSDKVITIIDTVKKKGGSKASKKYEDEIAELKAQLEKGNPVFTERMEKFKTKISELEAALQEKEGSIKQLQQEHYNYKVDSFLMKELDAYQFKNGEDTGYLQYRKNEILKEARNKASWVLTEDGSVMPRQKEDPNQPIFGDDNWEKPLDTKGMVAKLVKPFIVVNPQGGGGKGPYVPNGQGGGGYPPPKKEFDDSNLSEEQRRIMRENKKRREAQLGGS